MCDPVTVAPAAAVRSLTISASGLPSCRCQLGPAGLRFSQNSSGMLQVFQSSELFGFELEMHLKSHLHEVFFMDFCQHSKHTSFNLTAKAAQLGFHSS